ncbi:SDR family NAD(P)-dependent oxidoreductase [Roseateles violae]|uniref:SDR family NAD(P)-dependent oxidoreductase n=1 Tax=Roseateles violae TaxID=3058042 RepID=A0ABT8DYZ8_9BURK|nr:SDR family NAD(P)-dependent oxidoreductase [Pelomonas sp. PFR6]MDN3922821.1 SDR family NAD(P)-dependent oxidoreductase [Pelomonas sp. PFR6]
MPKTVLITGCSSGIGAALAREFQRRGHRVIASARQPAALAELAAAGLQTLALDVNDAASIEAAVAALQASAPDGLDLLINNAGYGQFGAVIDLQAEDLRAQFETNVIAPVMLSRALLPLLRRRPGACIAHVGSISGLLTTPFAGAYCASKAALHALADAMRMELAPLGLRVVTVQPGGIASHFGAAAKERVRLPDDSLYRGIAAFVRGRADAQQHGATPVDQFAATVATHLLDPRAGPICRTGSQSRKLPLFKRWLPTALLDRKLSERFGLDRL